KPTKKQPERTATSVKHNQRKQQQPATNPATGTETTAKKKDTVISLLQRQDGATLQELMSATGWQAHSVRGFLSGTLRKKLGLTIERTTRTSGDTTYQIVRTTTT